MKRATELRRLTPLRAVTPLARTPFPSRSWTTRESGERPVAARRVVRDTGPSRAVRLSVLERDGYACVCCGRSVIGQMYSLQHRIARGMGGSRGEHINCSCSLVTMLGSGCTACHGRVESNADPRDEARGYALRRGQVPRLVPVTVFDESGAGIPCYPSCDGRWLSEPETDGAA